MTAQEWLEELERLRKTATPGPWICKEGEGVDKDDVFITAEEREGMIGIAKIERGSPNAGMDEPFQSEQTANAAYIAAACNAVPKLVEMVKLAASRLECPYDDEECLYDDDDTVSCAHCKAQRLYDLTEPKE